MLRCSFPLLILSCLIPSTVYAQIQITIENGNEKIRIEIPKQGEGPPEVVSSPLAVPEFPENTFIIEHQRLEAALKDTTVDIDITRSQGNNSVLFKEIKVLDVIANANGKSTYFLATSAEQFKLLSRFLQGSLKLRPSSEPMQEKLVTSKVDVAKAGETEDEGVLLRQYLKWKTLGAASGLTQDDVSMMNALLQPDGINIEKNYLINTNPIASKRLDFATEIIKERYGDLVFQVFLEEPELNERLMLKSEKNGKMFYPDHSNYADGIYHQVRSGDFSGLDFLGNGSTEIHFTSLYHMPAVLTVKKPPQKDKDVSVVGQIMLRRPSLAQRSSVEVVLQRPDGTVVKDWDFNLAPLTFGGIYGGQQKANEEGLFKLSNLASQTVQIGFTQRPHFKERSNLELKPGMLAKVKYTLDGETLVVPPLVEYSTP